MKLNRRVRTVLLPVLASVVVAGCMKKTAEADRITAAEYDIYNLVVDSLCWRPQYPRLNLRTAELYIINDSTISLHNCFLMGNVRLSPYSGNLLPLDANPDRGGLQSKKGLDDSHRTVRSNPAMVFEYYQRHFPGHDWAAVKSEFDSLNQRTVGLDSARLSFSVPHFMVYSPEGRGYFGIIPGSPLEKKLGRSSGFIQLSRVAFDPSKRVAVLFFINGAPGGGQYGYVLVVRNRENAWYIRLLLLGMWL